MKYSQHHLGGPKPDSQTKEVFLSYADTPGPPPTKRRLKTRALALNILGQLRVKRLYSMVSEEKPQSIQDQLFPGKVNPLPDQMIKRSQIRRSKEYFYILAHRVLVGTTPQ